MMQQQRRAQFGEAPQSFGNAVIDSLLGPKAIQQDSIYPYEGRESSYDRVHSYNVGADLGRMIVMTAARSAVSLASLFPVQEGPPDLTYLTWEIETWGPSILPLVPEEGSYDVLPHSVVSKKASIQRRGISVPATIDSLNTQQGMNRLASQFAKIMASTHWTLALMVVQAIRSAHDGPMFRYQTSGQTMEVRRQIEFDAARAFSWAKDAKREPSYDLGLASAGLNHFTTGPFVVLVASDHIAMLNQFAKDTPTGVKLQTLTDGNRMLDMLTPQSMIQFSDGSIALPVQAHTSQDMRHRVQELNRHVRFAEYYILDGIPCNDLAYRTGKYLAAGGYSSCQRDRRIYNVHDSDQMDLIKFEDAFKHSGFVPGGEAGPNDYYLRYMADNHLKYNDPSKFGLNQGAIRHAPMRATRHGEGGGTRTVPVQVFGQFDRNVVSLEGHRAAAASIADILHQVEPHIDRVLLEGTTFLRELESVRWNDEWAHVLGTANGGHDILNLVVDGGAHRAHVPIVLPGRALTNNPVAFPQEGNGSPKLATTQIATLAGAIDDHGLPPGFVSVSGLELLGRVRGSLNPTQKVIDISKRASKLLNTAKNIYSTLKSIMPTAMVFDPQYREIIYLSALTGGFNTWFTNVFMNTHHVALYYNRPLNQAGGNNAQVNILTFLVITEGIHASMTTNNHDNFRPTTVGFFTAAGGNAAPGPGMVAGAQVAFGHPSLRPLLDGSPMKRTTWSAFWKPLGVHQANTRVRQRQGRSSNRGSMIDDDDLFGVRSVSAGGRFMQDAVANRGAPGLGAFGGQHRTHFSGSGTLGAVVLPPIANDPIDPNVFLPGVVIQSLNLHSLWLHADHITDESMRISLMTYSTAHCTDMKHFTAMFRRNIYVPFKIKVDRPKLVQEASSPIVLKPGLETGVTVITQSNLMPGGDAAHQRAEWTFSFWATAVVVSPQRIFILPNRIPVRYLSGGGIKFYTSQTQLRGGTRHSRPDLIPFVIPLSYVPHSYEPTGNIDFDNLHGGAHAPRYPDANVMEKRWQLARRAKSTRMHGNGWETSRGVFPDYSWRGASEDYRGGDRVKAAGHRSGASHPGCQKTWNGLSSTFVSYSRSITIAN